MDLGKLPRYLINTYKDFFKKEKLEYKKILCYIAIIFSSIVAVIGFVSAVVSVYIGDTLVRILLVTIALLFSILSYYSFVRLHKRKEMMGLLVFTIIVFLVAYYLPLFPPEYGLRQYDVDASILKFMITSILFVSIGVTGASFSMKPLYNYTSKSSEMSAYYILVVSIFLILYPLAVIVGNIVSNGIGGISWEFLTQDVRRHGTQGGIFPALVGTLLVMIGTALIALPLGIGSAIYLHEYAKKGRIVRVIRIAVDILQGTPSIVHGLFGLALFVPIFGISLLSGILIMGFLTLPIIIRSSEEALKSVPRSIREGSYAVGATRWQTIRRVVLPPALPGIITGGVLGLGRAAGETAPIMFTAVVFMGAGTPSTIFDPIQVLPYHLLELTKYIGAYPVEQNAWATAFLLLAVVIGMNAVAIIVRERFRVEF
jgi:phosphate transport system permease protein